MCKCTKKTGAYMARPQKKRCVCPRIQGYCFHGKSDSPLVEIPVDELEALRLCDLEERSQKDAASEMNISRGTLQRLLYSAHRKIAFALLYGRSIRTQGGVEADSFCERGRCRFCTEKKHTPSTQGDNAMKIAVASENNQVFQHFGHTPEFTVFTVEDGKIVSRQTLLCNGTGHGALAGLLQDGGVGMLICGGIGGGAQMALAEAGIKLIGGASGDVDEVVSAFLKDELNVNPNFQCHHHDGDKGHACGEHHCGSGHCH